MNSTLRRLGLLLIATVMDCSSTLAELLSHDGFDSLPANVALVGANGGNGFTGPWIAGVDAAIPISRFQLVTPTLEYPGLAATGARVRVTAGGSQGSRRVLSQPMGTDGTVRYLSLLVRSEAAIQPNTWFGLRLPGSAGADLRVGKPVGGNTSRFVLENAGGTLQVPSAKSIVVNEGVLLVVRLEFHAGNDRISLFVNPVPGAPEPGTPAAEKTDLDLGQVSSVALEGNSAWSADELRVGTTFASVTPIPPDFQLKIPLSGSVTEHVEVSRQIETVNPLPQGRTLTYELAGETHGARIHSATGLFTWTPEEDEQNQRRFFIVRATSNADPPASATTSFFLDVLEGNLPPQLEPINDRTVTEGGELSLQLVATDPDRPPQSIQFALPVAPPGMTVSTGGLITWRPAIDQAGRSYPVTVLAIDSMAGRAERRFNVTVVARTFLVAHWIGSADGDWNNPANWNIGRVPTDTMTEVFDVVWDDRPVRVRISSDITLLHFSWWSLGTLEFQPGGSLTLRTGLSCSGGTLTGPGRMTVRGRSDLYAPAITLREGCELHLQGFCELETNLRCDGNVRVVVGPSGNLSLTRGAGLLRLGGVPELRNEGRVAIHSLPEPVPFIFLRNLGRVDVFASTLKFNTSSDPDLLQEPGGRLVLGAGLDQGGNLDAKALLHAGSTLVGGGYLREARAEGLVQGRFRFGQISLGATATSKFEIVTPPDEVTSDQPITLAGRLEVGALRGSAVGPDEERVIVRATGGVAGEFSNAPFGERVQLPGLLGSFLLTRSADARSVVLRGFLPLAEPLAGVPLTYRLPGIPGDLDGCFVAPHPAVILPDGDWRGGQVRVEITDNFDAAHDGLGFRRNPAFPEADEITFEGPPDGDQAVRFRGALFGTVRLTPQRMICTLNAGADDEAVVALLGRLRYANDALTSEWYTTASAQYPPRNIVVTLTDALGEEKPVDRSVSFPVLWRLEIQTALSNILTFGTLLLPENREARLLTIGVFSTGQSLPVPFLDITWSQSCNPGVLAGVVPGHQGERDIRGLSAPYCCTVYASAAHLGASVQIYEGTQVQVPSFFGTFCPLGPPYTYVVPECATTPAGRAGLHAPIDPPASAESLAPFYTLEVLMRRSAGGQRLAGLYRQHGPEVLRLLLAQPALLRQSRELIGAFRPGVAALLAGNGDSVTMTPTMITQVDSLWTALLRDASPTLKAVLAGEQARFDNFRLFENASFSRWADLLQIPPPSRPMLHISLATHAGNRFIVVANDLPDTSLLLWRSADLKSWTPVPNADLQRDGISLRFTDPAPSPEAAFYQIRP